MVWAAGRCYSANEFRLACHNLVKIGRALIQAKTDERRGPAFDDDKPGGRIPEKDDGKAVWRKRDGPAKLGRGLAE